MSKPAITSSLRVYLRLLSYVKPYWLLFTISLLGYILFSLSQPAVAKLLEYFVEALENQPISLLNGLLANMNPAWLIPVMLLLIALLRGVGSFLGSYYLVQVSLSVIHDLRCVLFNHLITLPNSYFDRNNSGHLLSRITYNVSLVADAATDAIKIVIREGLTVGFTLAYLFYTNWQLSLAFIVLMPLIALVVTAASKRFRRLSEKIQVSMGDLTHVTSETISGYRVVKGFGGEHYEKQRFFASSRHNTRQNLKMVKASSVHTPTLQFLVSCMLAVLLSMVLQMQGDATTAQLIGFMTAAFLLPKPIRQLSEVNADIQEGIAAAESIFAILDEPSEQDDGDYVKDRVIGRLEFRNVGFCYNRADQPALQGISFTIAPGQTVALVGRSGAGKSTLANLVPRFYRHTSGDILLDGVPIAYYRLANLRNHIALVNQQVTLFNDTVARNIAYGDLDGMAADDVRLAAETAYATEFINHLPDGMHTLVGEDGVLLSGGQRQRLAIARALLKDAPILILDEATSALDTESERHIQAALDEVMKNRTTLVIAHRLSTIEKADTIIVMDHGRIVEQGHHTELLAKGGHYARLHQMQFQQMPEPQNNANNTNAAAKKATQSNTPT